MVARLGKPAGAVQVNITELSLENYGAGGQLIADRDAPVQGDAHAEPSQ
jgi:4-oxalocrotonate tautomerase